MRNKRGMSAVVTTLIIILLAIVAIGIVWVVVKNILDKGSEEITLTGLTLDLEITRATVEDDTLSITVKRNPGDGNLVGINFVISDGDNSVVVTRDTTLAELGVQTFTFTLSTLAVGDITSISIAPIFETSSGKEVTGEVLDTTTSDSGDFGTGDPDYGGEPDGNGEEPCTPECTGLDCGDDGCGGSCGDCLEGYSCADNQSCMDDTCDPTFSTCESQGYNCSIIYDSCGDMINCTLEFGGDCVFQYGEEGWVCSNNICVFEETCTDTCLSPISYTCGIHEICGVYLDCEELVGCDPGFECVGEDCVEILAINSGYVLNSWPPDTGLYFDSADLPTDLPGAGYTGYYVAFPSVDITQCFQIIGYVQDTTVYEYAIAELSIYQSITLVEGGDPVGTVYYIWETQFDCISYTPWP